MSVTQYSGTVTPLSTTDVVLLHARKLLLRELAQTPDRPTSVFLSRYVLTLVPLTIAGTVLAWWPQPFEFVLFAVIAGFTQNALGILMHEGSHHFFHRNRKTNDILANVLVCLPIFNTVQGYRSQHFEHHRHSGEEVDPYHELYGGYKASQDVIKGLVADVLGLTAIRSFLKRYREGTRPAGDQARWPIFALLCEQAAIGALLWWLTGSPLAWPFLWVFPLLTIPFAINRMRTFVEHYPGFEALPANRTTLVGILEYLCVAPYGYSHHFEHHFAPIVPYYRLAWAHAYLKSHGVELRLRQYNSTGYFRTFWRMMRELSAGAATSMSGAHAPLVEVEPTVCAVCGARAETPVASGRDYEYYSSADTFRFVRCGSCAHVFLNPRPTKRMARVIYPCNYYTVSGAHHSAFLSILGRIKARVLVRRLENVLPSLPPSGQVLEIGAGDGSLLLALRAARPDARLFALDLQFAPDRARALEARNIQCIEGLLEDSSLPSGCDLVIMNQLIEHLWELDSGLKKISGAVRAGGLVSIATPNLAGYDRRWFSRTAWGGYHFPRHLNLFTPESLGRLLERYCFRPVSHANLAAPLIWLATSQNIAGGYGVRARWFLTESNLPLLAAFTALDLLMSAFGRSTSNQQFIAIRE